jgi:hypothetical protein
MKAFISRSTSSSFEENTVCRSDAHDQTTLLFSDRPLPISRSLHLLTSIDSLFVQGFAEELGRPALLLSCEAKARIHREISGALVILPADVDLI